MAAVSTTCMLRSPSRAGAPRRMATFRSENTQVSSDVGKEGSDRQSRFGRRLSIETVIDGLDELAKQQPVRQKQTDMSDYTASVEARWPSLVAVVRSGKFEACIGLLIVMNCISMGIEAELLLGNAASFHMFVTVAEHLFTAFFLVEFVFRLIVFGWRIYLPLQRWGGSALNFMDMFLVLISGVLIVWILPLFQTNAGSLRTLSMLRGFRLMRLVRVVQRVDAFHEVWLLLRGLMESGRVLFWTVLVIFFLTYVFAVLGVVLIGVDLQKAYDDALSQGRASDELEILVRATGGVFATMQLLIQVLTLDSWSSIARPMQDFIPWCWAYFYLYIAVAVIVMMNLVTAVIVENALANSKKDADDFAVQKFRAKQEELLAFRHLFELMDMDGDGEITWSEFDAAFEDERLSAKLNSYGIDRNNCRDIFDLLDTGDGVISMDEFFDGISRMDGPAMATDLFRSTKSQEQLTKLLMQQNRELQEDVEELLQNTPGAKVRNRPNCLRRIACRPLAKEVFMKEVSGDRLTPSDAGSSGTWTKRRKTPGKGLLLQERGDQENGSSDDILERLSHVVDALMKTREEVRVMTASYNDRIDSCAEQIKAVAASLEDAHAGVPSFNRDNSSYVSKSCQETHSLQQSAWRKDRDKPSSKSHLGVLSLVRASPNSSSSKSILVDWHQSSRP